MKALRIAGLVILSLILFLSPNVFGLAFTLNRTVLNVDFITSEVKKLQVARWQRNSSFSCYLRN